MSEFCVSERTPRLPAHHGYRIESPVSTVQVSVRGCGALTPSVSVAEVAREVCPAATPEVPDRSPAKREASVPGCGITE